MDKFRKSFRTCSMQFFPNACITLYGVHLVHKTVSQRQDKFARRRTWNNTDTSWIAVFSSLISLSLNDIDHCQILVVHIHVSELFCIVWCIVQGKLCCNCTNLSLARYVKKVQCRFKYISSITHWYHHSSMPTKVSRSYSPAKNKLYTLLYILCGNMQKKHFRYNLLLRS